MEAQAQKADGQNFPVEITVASVPLTGGAASVCILRDITVAKQLEQEREQSRALLEHMGNVRANFGIGLCYIDRGEREKATEVFERLVKLDAAFEDEHKHLFNEFGISLRKAGMASETSPADLLRQVLYTCGT